ncbi:MAG: acyl carrier protein [Candidatus Acetothermia bacterium]
MEDLKEKVTYIISEQLMVDEEELTEDASFIEDLGADSLDTVEMIMEFEDEFGIEIPDEDAEELVTVGDALNYLEETLEETS